MAQPNISAIHPITVRIFLTKIPKSHLFSFGQEPLTSPHGDELWDVTHNQASSVIDVMEGENSPFSYYFVCTGLSISLLAD